MICKKFIVCMLFLGVYNMIYSQQPDYKIALPQILPASPDASQFVKAGVGNVNLSTGAATANIPLYTIKIKDFSYPLSLSYSTQGLKADEASSRVGFGWVLNADAMITRSVKGQPDEYTGRMAVPTDFNATTDAVYNYYMNATDPASGYDSQPDEFQFNCNGYSGKFVLDNNYNALITATCNVKITLTKSITPLSTSGYIGIITILTPDGVKYTFGAHFEKTTTHNLGFNDPYKLITKTAFFLDRIDIPTGEFIIFNYTAINTRINTGTTQTLQLGRVAGAQNCEGCGAHNSYTTQIDRVEYSTNYLNNITTSNGLVINFTYELRPDLSYDNRLKTLEVIGLKKYVFNYYDIPSTSVITGRFFLTKLQDIIDATSSYDYNFTYDNLTTVPLPITFLQDYLGYYSQSANASYFIPPTVNSNNTIDFSFRNPNEASTKKGTLTEIQYPTGGKEEFFYEGNTTSTRTQRNTMSTYNLEGNGGGSSGSSFPIVYNNSSITVPRDQSVTFTAYAADAILNDGFTETQGHPTVIVKVFEGSTLIASRSVIDYAATTSVAFTLYAGHTYKLEMTVNSYTDRGYCSIIYDTNPSTSPIYDYFNTAIPGVRLRQIKYTDPVTSSTHSKFYTYAALANLTASTGGLYQSVAFLSSPTVHSFCGQYGAFTTDCIVDTWSSSSTSSVYNYAGSGSLIYYTNVIESDDPNFVNGGTENVFNPNDDGGNQEYIKGEQVPYLTNGQFPSLSGAVATVNMFNKDKTIIQSEVNEYENLTYSVNLPSIYVRKRYTPYVTRPDRNDAFDVVRTHYDNTWIRLKSKTVNTIANGQTLTQKTSYTYRGPYNILPDTISTTDSKGVVVKTEKKYPTVQLDNDVVPDNDALNPVNNQLIAKNIITPVIEETSYRNGILLQEKVVRYKDWFNDNTILAPEITRVKESPSDLLHDELIFNAYDNTGDATQLQKVNDMPVIYLWDQTHSLPLCEVRNATQAQVAFCSFEVPSNYGNWSLTSGAVVTTTAFTGSACFTGTLTKTLSGSGNYLVSLWTNSSATVNGTGGTQVKTSNGWIMYQWTLTNPTTVTVQGTNMDDIRLYPKTALMTTYTYIPFIGMSSKSDADGSVSFYEYDSYHRLKNIKDYQGNIVKNFQYNYANSCGNNCVVLPMQTYSGSNTIGYPVGVFNVSVQLLGQATTQAQYISLWNANATNQAKGVLSAGVDALHFNLSLAAGQTPPPSLIGLRYYQVDLPYNQLDAIAPKNGEFVDFGDGISLRLGSNFNSANLPANTTAQGAAPYIHIIHTYPNSNLKTITIYHDDGPEYFDFDNNFNPATSLTKLQNLRGNIPQFTSRLGGSSYQQATMNTVANITNWSTINTVTQFNINTGDQSTPWLNMNYAQDCMANNKGLTTISTHAYVPYACGYRDLTFKISRLKSDWNTYFTELQYVTLNEDHWNHENLSALTKLNFFMLNATTQDHTNNHTSNPLIPLTTQVIDNVFIQIASGAGNAGVKNGTLAIRTGGTTRTTASDAAFNQLQAAGWLLIVDPTTVWP